MRNLMSYFKSNAVIPINCMNINAIVYNIKVHLPYLVVSTVFEVNIRFYVTVVNKPTNTSRFNAFNFENCREINDVRKVKSMTMSVTKAVTESGSKTE